MACLRGARGWRTGCDRHYSTDAKIATLRDPRARGRPELLPAYDAVLLHRLDLPRRHPAAFAAMQALEGRIDAPRMIALNARAEFDKQSFRAVAAEFLSGSGTQAARRDLSSALFGADFWRSRRTPAAGVRLSRGEHFDRRSARGCREVAARSAVHIRAVGVIQTIPSLAMLAFLIALVGHDRHPAGADCAVPTRCCRSAARMRA